MSRPQNKTEILKEMFPDAIDISVKLDREQSVKDLAGFPNLQDYEYHKKGMEDYQQITKEYKTLVSFLYEYSIILGDFPEAAKVNHEVNQKFALAITHTLEDKNQHIPWFMHITGMNRYDAEKVFESIKELASK